MLALFGQVHWRTLTIFIDKKAPEFCNAGAFCLADYSAASSAISSTAGTGFNWLAACS
jgi:hypothetical protein